MRIVQRWRGRKFCFRRYGNYWMHSVWLTREQIAELYPPHDPDGESE